MTHASWRTKGTKNTEIFTERRYQLTNHLTFENQKSEPHSLRHTFKIQNLTFSN